MIRKKEITSEKPDYFEDVENTNYLNFVAPPSSRLIVKRNGHSITRQIPKPVVLVDTRERSPFSFSRFPNWIADEKRQKLDAGDYTVEGMEDLQRKLKLR